MVVMDRGHYITSIQHCGLPTGLIVRYMHELDHSNIDDDHPFEIVGANRIETFRVWLQEKVGEYDYILNVSGEIVFFFLPRDCVDKVDDHPWLGKEVKYDDGEGFSSVFLYAYDREDKMRSFYVVDLKFGHLEFERSFVSYRPFTKHSGHIDGYWIAQSRAFINSDDGINGQKAVDLEDVLPNDGCSDRLLEDVIRFERLNIRLFD